MTDVITIGMIVMAMVAVASAVADAVSVLLMMTVHGGEMNLKFQLEEILEKKDQNDQNSTYYQEANRLMKIQIPHQPKRDQIHSGQLDQLTQVQKKEIEQKLKETHIRDQPNKPREQRKEPVKKLTKEELAAQKAEELKNKIERGLPDKDEDDEVKEVGTKSRFDLLDEE